MESFRALQREPEVTILPRMSDRNAAAEMIAKLEEEAEERGYQRGLADGIRKAKDAIEALGNAQGAPAKHHFVIRVHPGSGKSNSMGVVLGAIARMPGLTGSQLVERCAAEGTPVEERTLRTALFRLKTKGEIKKIGEGWHPVESKGRELPLHEEKGVFS